MHVFYLQQHVDFGFTVDFVCLLGCFQAEAMLAVVDCVHFPVNCVSNIFNMSGPFLCCRRRRRQFPSFPHSTSFNTILCQVMLNFTMLPMYKFCNFSTHFTWFAIYLVLGEQRMVWFSYDLSTNKKNWWGKKTCFRRPFFLCLRDDLQSPLFFMVRVIFLKISFVDWNIDMANVC